MVRPKVVLDSSAKFIIIIFAHTDIDDEIVFSVVFL
jgi:hypothetical protein